MQYLPVAYSPSGSWGNDVLTVETLSVEILSFLIKTIAVFSWELCSSELLFIHGRVTFYKTSDMSTSQVV